MIALQRSSSFLAGSLVKKFPKSYFIEVFNHSKCNKIQVRKCLESRKVDLTGAKQVYMFDTHLLIKSLQDSGIAPNQAETLAYSLVQITQGHMDFVNKNLITKEQQEILLQQILSHISSIKKDMIILEKSEFSNLKHEYEKQNIEIEQMKRHFKDEINNLKSGVALDMNLEKSRAKDAHAESEKALTKLENRIGIMSSEHDKHISGMDNKIEKEIANLLATYERYRNDVIKYAAGAVMTCLTICLGFYRLWS
ncbi:hypothetical protein HELRODRAFT_100974 [Helobdella robusta]|uniref:Mitochondrial calcium uniporter regulator 1 n=1 Tax=Helobdella robusta TaxID=6412 RepID=T1ED25_HELRO|nr:hypothetical protein HELRODRAFT_100974 [Helobdella robusta]ESO00559.1 hypothetical protein HELRODRAFT_100974 [Helobdella robusta]